jgi:seryl-tRNA synthetase
MTIGEGLFLLYVLILLGTNLVTALLLAIYLNKRLLSLDENAAKLHESIQRLEGFRDSQKLEEDITPQLTSYEKMRLQREEAFDERIARLKDEIAAKRPAVPYASMPAEELHPDVHNLPHDIIDTYRSKKYVEEVAR